MKEVDAAMERRNWVPDIDEMADQLVKDYQSERDAVQGIGGPTSMHGEGDSDALSTLASWNATAEANGEEITKDDLIGVIQILARRCAGKQP